MQHIPHSYLIYCKIAIQSISYQFSFCAQWYWMSRSSEEDSFEFFHQKHLLKRLSLLLIAHNGMNYFYLKIDILKT